MKYLTMTSFVLLAGLSGETMAACSGTQVTNTTTPTLSALISNSTVCAAAGSDTWQEQHRSDGLLWDFKKGPSDPVDPTGQVGNWSVNSTGNTVTYNYTGGSSYTYTVYDEGAGASYCFNGATVISGAKIKMNFIGGCP